MKKSSICIKDIPICECCKRSIPMRSYMGRQTKRCSCCNAYVKDLLYKLNHGKREIKRLRVIIYGQPNGSQRIRFKDNDNVARDK